MITGKQRSYLKSLAHELDPLFQLGKQGITENFVVQLDEALETKELIKVKILQNCDLDATLVANQLSEELGAEFVQSIGSKFVIYRPSKKNKKIQLPK